MTTLRLHFAIVLLVLSVLMSAPAFAEGIATVNIEKLLKESKAVSSLRDQTQDASEKVKKDIEAKDKKLAAEGQDLQKQRAVMDKDAFEKKSKEFEGKVNDLRNELQTRMGNLKEANARAMAEVQKSLIEIVGKIAKDKGYDIVAQTGQLLYVKDGLDISDEVIKQLNKEISDVKLDVKK